MSFVVVATTLRIGLVVTLVSLAGGAADPHHHAVDPVALDGCRAPDEPGCASCCADTDGGRCRYQIGDEDWTLYDVDPWYNGVAFVDGACPDDCPRCARCSARDEHLLATLAPRHGACVTERAVQQGAPVTVAASFAAPTDFPAWHAYCSAPGVPCNVVTHTAQGLELTLGGPPASAPAAYAWRSPLNFAVDLKERRDMKFLALQGTADPMVYPTQACALAQSIQSTNWHVINATGGTSTTAPAGPFSGGSCTTASTTVTWQSTAVPGSAPGAWTQPRNLVVYDGYDHDAGASGRRRSRGQGRHHGRVRPKPDWIRVQATPECDDRACEQAPGRHCATLSRAACRPPGGTLGLSSRADGVSRSGFVRFITCRCSRCKSDEHLRSHDSGKSQNERGPNPDDVACS